jgi:hypothetical protein
MFFTSIATTIHNPSLSSGEAFRRAKETFPVLASNLLRITVESTEKKKKGRGKIILPQGIDQKGKN